VLNDGKNLSRARSWWRSFANVPHLTRLSLSEGGVDGEGLAGPSGGGVLGARTPRKDLHGKVTLP